MMPVGKKKKPITILSGSGATLGLALAEYYSMLGVLARTCEIGGGAAAFVEGLKLAVLL